LDNELTTGEIQVSIYEVNGNAYSVDEEGFLEDPESWNESVAKALAVKEEIAELSESHWKVINYLRHYYLQFGTAPTAGKLLKATGFQLNEIYDLFPSGPGMGACKLAGLPKPVGCV
jgi:tRNA 2-thiouridine synthesizing protein E